MSKLITYHELSNIIDDVMYVKNNPGVVLEEGYNKLKDSNEWISIRERKPVFKGAYLTTVENKRTGELTIHTANWNGEWQCDRNIIAWMFLPTEYKEKQ